MRVVITGGAGFLGTLVAERLLQRGTFQGEALASVVIADQAPPRSTLMVGDTRVEAVTGDLIDTLPEVFSKPVHAVVHLASAVSAEVENDAALGMHSIVDATRALLTAATQQGAKGPKATLVFSSSVAVYGSDPAHPAPAIVNELTLPMPQSSYGAQKLACEYFIADATRKGNVDGRTARLMTVAIRPGKPNAAASGFLSSIVREPMAGYRAVCPVSPDMQVALASPANTVSGILAVAEAPRGSGRGRLDGNLPVNLPALTVRVSDLLGALSIVGGEATRRLVDIRPDPRIEAIVGSWPARFDNERAGTLGLSPDKSAIELVQDYARAHAIRG